jgi:hypothetical protein
MDKTNWSRFIEMKKIKKPRKPFNKKI